jgi:ribose transport system permease protein
MTSQGDKDRRRWLRSLSPKNIGALYALIVAIGVFSVASPTYFFSSQTIREIVNENAITGLIALAVLFPLAAGLFDLSIGIVAAMTGVVSAWTLGHITTDPFVAILIGLAVAAIAGLINSFVVVGLGIDSFIGTLATSSIFTAIILGLTNDVPITKNVYGTFSEDVALREFHGLTIPVFYALGLIFIISFALEATVFGRKIYALGFDTEVARLGGVRVARLQTSAFVICAIIAGIGGIAEVGVLGAGSPDIGNGFLIPTYAAAFLGATQFRHGRFNAWGTALAVLLLGTGATGLSLCGAPSWTLQMFEGVVLIAAVGFSSTHRAALLTRFRNREGSPPDLSADAGAITTNSAAQARSSTPEVIV